MSDPGPAATAAPKAWTSVLPRGRAGRALALHGVRASLAACVLACVGAQGAQGAARAGLCEQGRRQSPIDIVAPLRRPLPSLQFDYHAAPLRLVHDGHTVRVRFANHSQLVVGRQRYTLQQFHFHLPGGDRIAGEEFAMGMHYTHKSPSGQLMTLVLLFRVGQENPALAALLPHLSAPGQPEHTVAHQTVDAAAWLPAQRGYYVYDGSLTGPPCTEGVRWLVMKQPLQLSAAQLALLKSLIPANARPVQPLNGRPVLESE